MRPGVKGAIALLACLISSGAWAQSSILSGTAIQLAFLRPATGTQAPASEAGTPKPAPPPLPAARQAIDSVDLYDPGNPDRIRLQKIDEATQHLPYDANGFPDWMKALRQGLIKPRSGLNANDTMETFDLDVVMRNTKDMPHVRFPHRAHTEWLACSNCHPQPFPTTKGTLEIRMSNIFRGEYCGKCHDRVAFITFFSCDRCHSVPQSR